MGVRNNRHNDGGLKLVVDLDLEEELIDRLENLYVICIIIVPFFNLTVRACTLSLFELNKVLFLLGCRLCYFDTS